jgi:hypothetical protein
MPTVKIVNPAHGDGWTSFRRASEFVAEGGAVWRNRSDGRLAIKFLKYHPLDAAVRASKLIPEWDGRDRRGMPATLEEQLNMPLIGIKLPVHQRPQYDARGHRRS